MTRQTRAGRRTAGRKDRRRLPAAKKSAYFIGIKGVGMTMLAQFLAASGWRVSGSDVKDVFLTDKVLRREKIPVFSPFTAKNIPSRPDLIVYSSAYDAKNNPELAYIRKRPARFQGVRVLSFAVALGEIFNRHYGLAVCGSHGKTTTTAWLGYVLWRAGKSPSVLVGSRVPQFKGSSLKGRSRYFVAEVDEYQNKFQYFKPRAAVLNNIDYDHPDYFKTPAAYIKAFADFLKKIPARGFLVMNAGDKNVNKIKKNCRGKIITYALAAKGDGSAKKGSGKSARLRADYLAADPRLKDGREFFHVFYRGRDWGEFASRLAGEHNVLNALAVIAAARALKVPLKKIRKHLAGFLGAERRSQVLGRYRGALMIDDYAHHPTEIKATLKALKAAYPKKRLLAVFHPHTFTRTKALFKGFVAGFKDADELIILDIYASARERRGGVSGAQLVRDIGRENGRRGRKQPVRHIPTLKAAAAYLRRHLGHNDLLVLMGAGDVFRVGEDLLKKI